MAGSAFAGSPATMPEDTKARKSADGSSGSAGARAGKEKPAAKDAARKKTDKQASGAQGQLDKAGSADQPRGTTGSRAGVTGGPAATGGHTGSTTNQSNSPATGNK